MSVRARRCKATGTLTKPDGIECSRIQQQAMNPSKKPLQSETIFYSC